MKSTFSLGTGLVGGSIIALLFSNLIAGLYGSIIIYFLSESFKK